MSFLHLFRTDRLPLLLAPMAGFTDAAMRRQCCLHGADLTYTEMVNDRGLLHESDKTWHLLETFPDEKQVVAHLYGSEPEILAEAAARVAATKRFVAIDLNAGCPVHKITASGAGAALINNPERVYEILTAMRRAVSLPLTLKTRLGPHPGRITVFELLAAAEAAGADAFTLHARFTSQGHGGAPRLDLLAEVKQRARIPVIGNGGIRSAYDAQQMVRETGVDAVMIARAAIGNPWLFNEIHTALAAGMSLPVHDATHHRVRRELSEIQVALDAHMADELALIQLIRNRYAMPRGVCNPEETLVTIFRCHLFRYLSGLKGSSYVRGRLSAIKTLDDIHEAVAACLEREEAYRQSAPVEGTTRASSVASVAGR